LFFSSFASFQLTSDTYSVLCGIEHLCCGCKYRWLISSILSFVSVFYWV